MNSASYTPYLLVVLLFCIELLSLINEISRFVNNTLTFCQIIRHFFDFDASFNLYFAQNLEIYAFPNVTLD